MRPRVVTAVQEMGRITGVATPSIDIVLGLVQHLGRTQGLYPTFPEAESDETSTDRPSSASAG